MKTLPIEDIALPTGVKNLNKFADKRYSNKFRTTMNNLIWII